MQSQMALMVCKRFRSNNEAGQSTLEYLLVTLAFLAIILAFGSLHNALKEGLFVDHGLMSASHHVQLSAPGSSADIFLY